MIFLHIICVVFYSCVASGLPNPLSDEFIDLINGSNSTWRAGRNFPDDIPPSHVKRLMGIKMSENHRRSFWNLPVQYHPADLIESLPENFDSRNKWPYCSSLNEIRNQGGCGSCWAVSAASAMTDRVCIYSKGTKNFHFSAEDILSCCPYCSSVTGDGCHGSPSIVLAWNYWRDFGIVSGGPYNSHHGCRPYEIEPCGRGTKERYCSKVKAPPCHKSCEKSYKKMNNSDKIFTQDKHFGKKVYAIHSDEDHIRAEIYRNGPVGAVFNVFDDFVYNYTGGVYIHRDGGVSNEYHAVKITGWGVDKGTKYWLIANSWGTGWGDMGGFFKFLRGVNHCGIESYVVAGEPSL
ncbi:papain family cysteine protease domain-containing protein [Phthorimaea operculella]|nr:papain family cysteine protease domain-containing protein [Phthorimaea operculella]